MVFNEKNILKIVFVGLMLVVLSAVGFAQPDSFCTDSQTLLIQSNLTIDGDNILIENTEVCEYGCFNKTLVTATTPFPAGECSPPPVQRTWMVFGAFILFFVLMFLANFVTRRGN